MDGYEEARTDACSYNTVHSNRDDRLEGAVKQMPTGSCKKETALRESERMDGCERTMVLMHTRW